MTEYIKREDALKMCSGEIQNIRYMTDPFGKRFEYVAGARRINADEIAEQIKKIPSADVVEIKKEGEWDMFDLISSAYYGKGMYFKQDNGTVYSRHSGEYMTVDEAIREFISLIDEENVGFLPSVTTAWADGEAPTYVLQKRGKWMHKKITADFHAIGQCSVCKEIRRIDNFCPHCGADMREES